MQLKFATAEVNGSLNSAQDDIESLQPRLLDDVPDDFHMISEVDEGEADPKRLKAKLQRAEKKLGKIKYLGDGKIRPSDRHIRIGTILMILIPSAPMLSIM